MNKSLLSLVLAAGLSGGCGDPGREVPLYGTFEGTMTSIEPAGENSFRQFKAVTFSDGERSFKVDAFYDGDKTWRVRFMPDREGPWSYAWQDGATGKFVCTAGENSQNHGHVKRDPEHLRYLIYDDGIAHYWFGGKWIGWTQYMPSPESPIIDKQLTEYLDTCRKYRHNGLLIEIALGPLADDQFSWDLEHIHHAEWLVREMGRRGIYTHVTLFDTWSRARGESKVNTLGSKQVFNVWADGDEDAKENYIRTVIARFAGFYNVYWELGNEMGHKPNSGKEFVKRANAKYVPWMRKYDPYGLVIGLSEEIWRSTEVDVGFLHQTNERGLPRESDKRPTIMNELVRGGIKEVLWKGSTIRDSINRLAYRRTFWRVFTYGGCGSSEATCLKLDKPLNQAVLDVMMDQKYLRDFLTALPVHINEMDTDKGFVLAGPGQASTRRKTGSAYVTYFLLDPDQSVPAGEVELSLPAGKYRIAWHDPKTGKDLTGQTILAQGKTTRLAHPGFTEDIVLRVTADRLGSP